MTKKKRGARRAPGERLRKYSTAFPTDGTGHDYMVRDIPRETWERARERALREQQSLRVVLITMLDAYAKGAP